MSVRKSKEQFVNDAIKVHGNKYCYDNVDYISNRVKICIKCPTHGEFWQSILLPICQTTRSRF